MYLNFNQFSSIYEQTTLKRRFKNTNHNLPDNNSLKSFDSINLHVSVNQSYLISNIAIMLLFWHLMVIIILLWYYYLVYIVCELCAINLLVLQLNLYLSQTMIREIKTVLATFGKLLKLHLSSAAFWKKAAKGVWKVAKSSNKVAKLATLVPTGPGSTDTFDNPNRENTKY